MGQSVSNAIFNFEKDHGVLKKAIDIFDISFDGTWGSAGNFSI